MLGAKARARIKKSQSEERNRMRLLRGGGLAQSKDPRLIFHEDNTAMISVCKNGRNPTMRWLGRVHGISINFIHQEVLKPYILLGHINTEGMAGDIYTKSFSESDAAAWTRARQNINAADEGIKSSLSPDALNLGKDEQRSTPEIREIC